MIDPTNIPVDISAAAQRLDEYFRSEGIEEWCLGPVCSRKFYEKLQEAERAKLSGIPWNWGAWCGYNGGIP